MKIPIFILLAFSILAAGCIKMDQTLTIKENGSGSLETTYSLSEQSIAQMKAMFKLKKQMAMASLETDTPIPDDDSMQMFLNPVEEKIRREIMKYEKYGITLEKIKIESRNAWRQVQMKILFDDLAEVAETDVFQKHGFTLARNSDGNYVFYRASEKKDDKPIPAVSGLNATESLAPILGGFRIVSRIKTPGRILRTNAHEKSPYAVTWVFDFNKDPNALQVLQNQDFMIVFDGKGINIPEI